MQDCWLTASWTIHYACPTPPPICWPTCAPARTVGIGWRAFCANRYSGGWPGSHGSYVTFRPPPRNVPRRSADRAIADPPTGNGGDSPCPEAVTKLELVGVVCGRRS